MEKKIWRVEIHDDCGCQIGKHVVCVWNLQECWYDVYFKGIHCGTVTRQNYGTLRPTSDFLSGTILRVEKEHMNILIGQRRERILWKNRRIHCLHEKRAA